METEEIILDATTARVVDLLQQINELNTMIALHRTASQDDFMRKQYEYKKTEMMLLHTKNSRKPYKHKMILKKCLPLCADL
jgi:hypothetical protein